MIMKHTFLLFSKDIIMKYVWAGAVFVIASESNI